jgi:hypothetical protein
MANSANILLHGLFVLQYQGNTLVAMTPDHHHHHFLERQQGQQGDDHNPFPPLKTDYDFTSLSGIDVQRPFPKTMPQFSKTKTGVGDLVVNPGSAKNYRSRIALSLPIEIMVLRSGGQLNDYHSDPKSNVGNDIQINSGPDLGLVTLLHYETSGPSFTVNLFAEHRTPQSPASKMNPVLVAAKSLFTNGSAFDLQLVDCIDCNVPTICPDNPFPAKAQGYGVQRDDEHSFGEIYDGQDCATGAGTDVANCVQFGLRG